MGWKRDNPPFMMASVAYFFLNIPWITQDDPVRLERGEEKVVDVIDPNKTMTTVRMTFEGASPYEYYDLFIDPDTDLLRGVQYTMANRKILDAFGMKDRDFAGPLVKVYTDYVDVDGLKYSARYHTYIPAANNKHYGDHQVSDYSLRKPFDETRLVVPKDAVIDPLSVEN